MSESAFPAIEQTPPARRDTFAPRLVAGFSILLAWEGVVRVAAPAYVAKPSGILFVLPRVIVDPNFIAATTATLLSVAEGIAIALVLGSFIGLMIGRSVIAERLLRHYVNGFYAMPMIVVLPLVSLWFGYSAAARLATIIFAAVFSIILNVADGAKSVPQEYLEVAHSFRSDRLRAMIDVVLPAATPYFLAGFRLAAGRALIGAVVAEFFTGIGGLGYSIRSHCSSLSQNRFLRTIPIPATGQGFHAGGGGTAVHRAAQHRH